MMSWFIFHTCVLGKHWVRVLGELAASSLLQCIRTQLRATLGSRVLVTLWHPAAHLFHSRTHSLAFTFTQVCIDMHEALHAPVHHHHV